MSGRRLVLVLSVLFTLACGGGGSRTLSRAEIEQAARLTVPATATNIDASTERGIDSMIQLRLTLPEEDVPALLDGTGLTLGPGEGLANPFRTDPPEPGWWQPDSVPGSRAGEALDGSFARKIRVDPGSDGQVHVFYQAFTL
jgi:hypothetical protein